MLALLTAAVLAVKGGKIWMDQAVLLLISSSVIPNLTDLITKAKASTKLKAWLSGGLAIVTAVVICLTVHGGTTDLKTLALAALGALFATQGAHRFFKATGVSDAVENFTPTMGLGKPVEKPDAAVGQPNPVEAPEPAPVAPQSVPAAPVAPAPVAPADPAPPVAGDLPV